MAGEGVWKDKYNIGVQQIDSQHKQLLLTIEELLQAVRTEGENGKASYKSTMAYLKDYVVMHFSTEEMYMQSINYSQIERQKRLHAEFTQWLHEEELRLIRCDYDVPMVQNLARALTKWWIYHIMKEDKLIATEIAKECT